MVEDSGKWMKNKGKCAGKTKKVFAVFNLEHKPAERLQKEKGCQTFVNQKTQSSMYVCSALLCPNDR